MCNITSHFFSLHRWRSLWRWWSLWMRRCAMRDVATQAPEAMNAVSANYVSNSIIIQQIENNVFIMFCFVSFPNLQLIS